MSKGFFKNINYIKELNVAEHIILWLNVVLSLAFFITQLAWLKAYDKWPTWLSFIATIISIFSVMAGAKKRILCPILGIVASIFLIFVAWSQTLYGSMIMYGFNIIMQTVTLILWIKSSTDKYSINPKRAKWYAVLIYTLILIGLTALFTWVEGLEGFYKFWSGGSVKEKPMLAIRIFDATNLVFTIGCFIPLVKRYDQVWWVYIVCDVAILITWILKAAYANNNVDLFTALTMVVSGACMTATCIMGLIEWKKSTNKTKNQEQNKIESNVKKETI